MGFSTCAFVNPFFKEHNHEPIASSSQDVDRDCAWTTAWPTAAASNTQPVWFWVTIGLRGVFATMLLLDVLGIIKVIRR
jgi:hypothetical protein